MSTALDEGLWTTEETARYLKVNATTLTTWRYLGRGPKFVKVGRAVRYKPSEVLSWLDQRPETLHRGGDAA